MSFFNSLFKKHIKTKFTKGLADIVYSTNQEKYEHQTFQHINQSNPLSIEQNLKRSVSIIDCYFSDIYNKNVIFISTDQVSLYLTSTVFVSCISQDGVIFLQRARCLTMTHICSANSGTRELYGILNYDCTDEDFTLCLYNSFVNSTTRTEDTSCIIRSLNGNQYFKCNNITGSISCGFKFDTPNYFTFSMTTAINCGYRCLELIGYDQSRCNRAIDKEIELVNFISNGYQTLRLSSSCEYTLTISNSFLINTNNSPDLYITENEFKMNVVVQFCFILSGYQDGDRIEFRNCTRISYNNDNMSDYIVLYPHYTYEDICSGPNETDENYSAYACNNGKCFGDSCGKTIGFPEYVVPYTTIFHDDIHTATSNTFFPTSYFTLTAAFSQSEAFSPSQHFTKSQTFSQLKTLTFNQLKTPTFSQFKTITSSQLKTPTFSQFKTITSSQFKTLTFNQLKTPTFRQFKTLTFSQLKTPTFSQLKTLTFSRLKTVSNVISSKKVFTLMSNTQSFLVIKTVTQEVSYLMSFIFQETVNQEGEKTFISTDTKVPSYLLYIMTSYSQTVVASIFEHEISQKKKKISDGELIGIICGSAAVFFFTIGIVFIAYNKRNEVYSEVSVFEDSSDDNHVISEQKVDLESNIANIDDWI